ncbi:MAG: YceD family protein [Marivita sp.]|uniref:YceD family protein n=1 Tax=Marivita sp. TaxID=2003365 RepID=UPI003EF372E1
MAQPVLKPGEFRVNDLPTWAPTSFDLQPDAAARAAISDEVTVLALKKLRFEGEIAPYGARGWTLTGKLGATVVQPCVVTLDPVTTRLDEVVERVFLPAEMIEEDAPGAETEIPEDISTEPLGTIISAYEVMIESLLLALPLYPRAGDAELGSATFAEDGITPLKDEDTKPFAGLAGLRDQLDKKS